MTQKLSGTETGLGDVKMAVGVATPAKMEAGGLVQVNKPDVDVQSSHRWMKLLSLLLLTPQYAVLILLMRYVRTRNAPMFVTSTTVLMAEVFKTLTCLVIIFIQQKGPKGCFSHLYEFLICRPWDFVKVCVPSMLFVVQNNLVFVAISNLDAATFQVTYQLKILTTAIFSVVLLGKRLSVSQWVALLLLFAGVSIIQVKQAMASSVVKATTASSPTPEAKPSEQNEQNYFTGMVAVLVCCCLSGFASVFFELLLKGGKQTVWMRNVQLGLSGIVLGALACVVHDGRKIANQGFFYGYDGLVWTVVSLQSLGGLLVAAVMKYADNILKGFSTAGSILLSCVASVYIFDFKMDDIFIIGMSSVLVAVYLYSSYPPIQPGTEMEVQPPGNKSSGKLLSR
ncbi:UDP-N-acetylglucosamine transporter-like [Littorina saxatilis]|uniref:Uncharacterized protein n=1 Tax=Littorina saxatilis TaxID=31220 RepID=A0AAN9GAF7_9CAEN